MPNQPPAGDAEQEKIRKELEKAGLYDVLVHLHEQEHDEESCFCTTEISGAYSKLLEIISARDQAQREALENQLKAKADQLDKIIDNYSIHAARGYPKGTLARKVLKKRIRAALHQLKNPERS